MIAPISSYIRLLANKTSRVKDGSEDILEIVARDPDGKLSKLIQYIGDTGNVGHSFDIVVDPDNRETKKSFGWDGDGADRIIEIRFNGERVK